LDWAHWFRAYSVSVVVLVASLAALSRRWQHFLFLFSLFWMPLSIISALAILILTITIVGILLIPALLLAILAANAYFGYIGVQSSMNLPKGSPAIMTLVLAVIATAITYGIIDMII
jgi:hypothetical protein